MSDFHLSLLFMALKDVEALIETISDIQALIDARLMSSKNGEGLIPLLFNEFFRNIRQPSASVLLNENKEEFRCFLEKKVRERLKKNLGERNNQQQSNDNELQNINQCHQQPLRPS